MGTLGFKHFVDTIDFSQYNFSNMIAMDERSVKTWAKKRIIAKHEKFSPRILKEINLQ